MFCTGCGKKLDVRERFCTQCGTRVSNSGLGQSSFEKPNQIENEQAQPISQTGNGNRNISNEYNPPWIWALPVGMLLLFLILGGALFAYQTHVNQLVDSERTKAENYAIAGDYSSAKAQISDALSKRPSNAALLSDQKWVAIGMDIQTKLQSASDSMKKQQFDQALTTINQAQNSNTIAQGTFSTQISKLINDKRTAVTVAKIKSQMKDKNTIDGLTPLLSQLSSYTIPEAKDTEQQICDRIANISYDTANQLLSKKQFSDALQAVNVGLQYASGNAKLLSFKDTITKQQSDFEQQEAQRIAQAMADQAKEDETNHSHAVQVVSISGKPNETGDFVIQGTVKNIGTRSIGMIEVTYTVYDANNNELGTYTTYVYPNYLNPNDTGQFQDTQYGLWNGQSVKVTNITWMIE